MEYEYAKHIYWIHRLVLPFRIRVDLGLLARKGYPQLDKTHKMEPHHQMQFSVVLRTPILSGLKPIQG